VEIESLRARIFRHVAGRLGSSPVAIFQGQVWGAVAPTLLLLVKLSDQSSLGSIADRHKCAFSARKGAAIEVQTKTLLQAPGRERTCFWQLLKHAWLIDVLFRACCLLSFLRLSESSTPPRNFAEEVSVESSPAENLGVTIVHEAPAAGGHRRDAEAPRAGGQREDANVGACWCVLFCYKTR